MSIDVKKVQGRRQLHFESYDDILSEVTTLQSSGPIKSLGNWTAGQNLEHIAKAIDVSIDGVDYRLPLPLRWLARLFRNWFLSHPMRPGVNLPGSLESAFGPQDSTSESDGCQLLIAALERIKSTTKRSASPAFGEMTEADWIRLHCRHAELHLSFLLPAS